MKIIQGLRISKQLTQAELAKKLGIDPSTVAKWETADAYPRADKLPELAKVLGCSIDDLFEREGVNVE